MNGSRSDGYNLTTIQRFLKVSRDRRCPMKIARKCETKRETAVGQSLITAVRERLATPIVCKCPSSTSLGSDWPLWLARSLANLTRHLLVGADLSF